MGMLVDDAIVVVESMYTRMRRGVDTTQAAIEALKEVVSPVTASVLTTMAAFLPLMLLPGILGEFMLVIPLVVTVALAISLLEAYWMLPAHLIVSKPDYSVKKGHARGWYRIQVLREGFTHGLQLFYSRLLIASLRRPKSLLLALFLLFCGAVYALQSGQIKVNFFAGEPFPVLYVNLKMKEGTPIDYTLEKVKQLENRVKQDFERDDYREIVSYAGIYFTQTEPLFGEHYGQVMISLTETTPEALLILHKRVKARFKQMTGVEEMSLLQLEDGPPVSRAISIKVQGAEFAAIQTAVVDLQHILKAVPEIENIMIQDSAGTMELKLQLNQDAVHRAGLSPDQVMRDIRLLAEGEIVTSFQHRGEEVDIRVKAGMNSQQENNKRGQGAKTIENWLQTPIGFFDEHSGKLLSIPLNELVKVDY
ncbi:MAG: efflux RND transporter permease subunit [gamma proteobacterium symbiont of Bathyaustriella thionipta]|nr:efflux RND transporter permease subunit [gamma proteobacterium symbiont of Bathyaustriella thionipta]MCU7953368.1 efflux RND transporter permease subunit [gamma proteobacterium symbiont of Bathyaustriella thionipta]MCU7955752.1 efflux RND transporter permease subunit [gamma proteobacterium symbiont of Bathyaustriella thionipta]MCU7965921.1 efflux RND transporter permease subunit [gamma proteobacterium symbiont of Bathyaustriella thionipta]